MEAAASVEGECLPPTHQVSNNSDDDAPMPTSLPGAAAATTATATATRRRIKIVRQSQAEVEAEEAAESAKFREAVEQWRAERAAGGGSVRVARAYRHKSVVHCSRNCLSLIHI